MLRELYVVGTKSRLVNLYIGGEVGTRWLTVLGDVYEAVFVKPGELDIKCVYSVEETLGP